MLLCEGGMSLKGSTSSTPTPANIRSSPCCNEESKRAARRILVERSTGKHRSLPSATGRFVLMICSRVPSFFPSPPVFFSLCLRALCMYLFVQISWCITMRQQSRRTFSIESTCQPQAAFVSAVTCWQ